MADKFVKWLILGTSENMEKFTSKVSGVAQPVETEVTPDYVARIFMVDKNQEEQFLKESELDSYELSVCKGWSDQWISLQC